MADNTPCATIKKPLVLRAGGLRLECAPAASALRVWDHGRRMRLVLSATLDWLRPVLDGQAVTWHWTGAAAHGDAIRVDFEAAGLKQARLYLRARRGFIELQSEFVATGACRLNRLEIAPVDTGLNLYDVVNFRNRHFTPHTWPELNLGGDGCITDTYSGDWQFAPHPTMFVFRKNDLHLFFGALDLPRAFGMYLNVGQYRVRHWYLDYGPAGHGQPLRAGERFQSPRFCLFLDRGRDVHDTIRRYTRLLVQEGLVPAPQRKKRQVWHTAPLYCTWIDQTNAAKALVPAELYEQQPAVQPATAKLTEPFVRDALAVIEREKLPFRTILLDEGWEVARGQWEPHPQRFPNFRAHEQNIPDFHRCVRPPGRREICRQILLEIMKIEAHRAERRGCGKHAGPLRMLPYIRTEHVIGAIEVDEFRQPGMTRAADVAGVRFESSHQPVKEFVQMVKVVFLAAPPWIMDRHIGMDLIRLKICFYAVEIVAAGCR